MKRVAIAAGLLLLMLDSALAATDCEAYEEAYATAKYRMEEIGGSSYRERYDLVNDLIDAAIVYLAYCKEQISLDEQYQIRQVIKKGDRKRRAYFRGAVREYHVLYGIRPNVSEIYQDGSGENGGGSPSKERSAPQSPPRFPPVQQPMMPPVEH
ncbi:hypothetical protein [Sulfurimonas sp. HSL3-7]|uniref:hypothetical protein n=1 Tax=Sulfonitrofixus jiaomeiensis TaxID=3131938 RepID=UPI0031F86A31